MEQVSSARPTGKFPEKVENRKRWSRFLGWNFRTECRVPLTFLVVCTSSRSTVEHPATYRGVRPNGTTFYRSEIPLLLPPKFPFFFVNGKRPQRRVKFFLQIAKTITRMGLTVFCKLVIFWAVMPFSENFTLTARKGRPDEKR